MTLDEGIKGILLIPDNLSILADDFMRVRLSLNHGNIREASQPPPEGDLYAYGELLRNELDGFTKGHAHHKISLYHSQDSLVICSIEVTGARTPLKVTVERPGVDLGTVLPEINQLLSQQFSQWVYVKRGLRIFDGLRFYICKAPRLIDWTRTQALNDSDDLISEVLASRNREREVTLDGAR
jgi:hypothetical protein